MNRTYEEIAQQALDAAAAENNKQRKRLIAKKVTLLSASAAMLTLTIFALSRAWFTNNKDVSAAGMGVKSTDLPFEVAAVNDNDYNILNVSAFNEINETVDKSSYTDGAEGAYTDDAGTTSYYKNDNGATLMLRANTSDNDGDDDGEIEPGDSGKIEFYIIPHQDGELSVTIDLDMVGYIAIETTTTETKDGDTTTSTSYAYQKISKLTDKTIYKSYTVDSSGTKTKVSTSSAELSALKNAENYLNGHIMFFTGGNTTDKDTDGNLSYLFNGFLSGREYTETFTGTKGKPKLVTLYWVWPNTLGQLAVNTGSENYNNDIVISGTPIVEQGSNDQTSIINYLKGDTWSRVFKADSNVTSDSIASLVNSVSTDNTSFNNLSSAFNNADFEIGRNIDYFMIEVTVTESSASN